MIRLHIRVCMQLPFFSNNPLCMSSFHVYYKNWCNLYWYFELFCDIKFIGFPGVFQILFDYLRIVFLSQFSNCLRRLVAITVDILCSRHGGLYSVHLSTLLQRQSCTWRRQSSPRGLTSMVCFMSLHQHFTDMCETRDMAAACLIILFLYSYFLCTSWFFVALILRSVSLVILLSCWFACDWD